MGKMKNFLLILGLFAFLAVALGAKARTWASGEKPDQAIKMDINELLSSPRNYLHGMVEFKCRFATIGRLFRKNTEEFSEETHLNLAVWQPEAKLWNRQDRRNVMPSLYINRENGQLCQQISKLPRYRMVIITGRVVSDYANLPWIEVTAVRLIEDDRVNDQLLQQVDKIFEQLKNNRLDNAKNIFTLLDNATTPEYIRSEITTAIANATPKIRETNPAQSLVDSARNAATVGDFNAAIAFLKDARNKDSALENTVWYNQELAAYLLESEYSTKLEMAKEKLIMANSLSDSKNVRILNQLADIEMKRNNPDEAEKFIRLALMADKDDSYAQKTLAQITSEKLAAEIKNTKIVSQYLEAGQNFLGKGDFANAERQLRIAVKNNEENAPALLASALLAQGKVEEARQLLTTTSVVSDTSNEVTVKPLTTNEEKVILPVEPRTGSLVENNNKTQEIPASVDTDFNDIFTKMNEMKNDLESSRNDSFAETKAVALNVVERVNKQVATIQPVAEKETLNHKEIELPKLPEMEAAPKNMSKLPEWAR